MGKDTPKTLARPSGLADRGRSARVGSCHVRAASTAGTTKKALGRAPARVSGEPAGFDSRACD